MASYITSKSVIAVGAVLPGLATIAVVLRLYSRRLKSVHFGIDDCLIVASLVSILQPGLRALLIQNPPQILTIGMGIMLITGKSFHSLAPFAALIVVKVQAQLCMH